MKFFFFRFNFGDFPWQSTHYDSSAVGMGLIPDWGTKIPCAKWHGQKKSSVCVNCIVVTTRAFNMFSK